MTRGDTRYLRPFSSSIQLKTTLTFTGLIEPDIAVQAGVVREIDLAMRRRR